MRWTRSVRLTSVGQRTAKSCRSDAPGPASSLREEAQATVSTKPGHRGEREVSRKTIARGMPGDFRCDRGDYTRLPFFLSAPRLRMHWASGIPCALYSQRGETFLARLGQIPPRDRGVVSGIQRHCERSEAIHLAAQR